MSHNSLHPELMRRWFSRGGGGVVDPKVDPKESLFLTMHRTYGTHGDVNCERMHAASTLINTLIPFGIKRRFALSNLNRSVGVGNRVG